jgi:hypothetical protein
VGDSLRISGRSDIRTEKAVGEAHVQGREEFGEGIRGTQQMIIDTAVNHDQSPDLTTAARSWGMSTWPHLGQGRLL